METKNEVLELANLFRLVGRKNPMEESLRMKLLSGLKEFDTTLKKSFLVGRLFRLGRGRFGSVSRSILKDKSVYLPSQEITVPIINKLSHPSTSKKPLKNRLYQLIKQKAFKRLPHKNPLAHKKSLGDCIILDHNKQSAYILRDSLCLEKRMEHLGRLLHYSGRETTEYSMRDRIDTFSQELSFLARATRVNEQNVKTTQV